MHTVIRSHEICAGHRVVGHESKCRHLHGHNYVFHFKVQPRKQPLSTEQLVELGDKLLQGKITDEQYFAEKGKAALDTVGRVVDFSVVKATLCQWLEDNWDHKFLHWEKDDLIKGVKEAISIDETEMFVGAEDQEHFFNSFVELPFNPTAENLAQYIVDVIGPQLLSEHGVELVSCVIEETSKCHVEYSK